MASRSLRHAELAAIVVAAALSLLFHLRLLSQLPSEADHRAAAEHIAGQALDGDVILLHPWWTERARLFAPKNVPVVGHLGSDGDPLVDHPRIWLVSQPDLPRAQRRAFDERFLNGRRAIGEPLSFGPIEVSLHANARHRPLVWSAARDGKLPRTGWHEVRFAPKRCLTVPLEGSSAEVELPSLPAGAELTLEAGFIWDSAHRGGSEVDLQLITEGGTQLSIVLPPKREGLQGRTLAPFAGARQARLQVRTSRPAPRELCVDIAVRGEPR